MVKTSNLINQHKRMAMGDAKMSGETFGTDTLRSKATMAHPDVTANLNGYMSDGDRGIGGGIQHTKGMMPAQAAPDHGKMYADGPGEWMRGK